MLHIAYKGHDGWIPMMRLPGARYLFSDELGEVFVRSKEPERSGIPPPDGVLLDQDNHSYTRVSRRAAEGPQFYHELRGRIEEAREALRDHLALNGYTVLLPKSEIN